MDTRVNVTLAALALLLALPGSGGARHAAAEAYGWPVKPFDAPHSVRSTFGEPRTWFAGAPTEVAVDRGSGSFSFHQGIDVVAPDGTPVYPVRSGVARRLGGMTVEVESGSTTFQYWHIVPAIRDGDEVIADRTVLGRIRRSYGHVHLTELEHGRAVDPLAPGHLRPYRDAVPPTVGRISLRRPGGTAELLPHLVRGRVEVVADVTDASGGTGMWAAMPTAPERVSWHLERAGDGTAVTHERVSFDALAPLPPNSRFWSTYARGTWQNMPTFHEHRYWRIPGSFLFRVAALDTHALRDGIYTVVVTARDAGGNTASGRLTFLVWNRPGLPPKTPQS